MYNIYIGYDRTNNPDVLKKCIESIRGIKDDVVLIRHLKAGELQDSGILFRHTIYDNEGEFAPKFLIPYLMKYVGWALYVDPLVQVESSLNNLWAERDYDCAVMTAERSANSPLIFFNCSHPYTKQLTKNEVNTADFDWLNDFRWAGDDICRLPENFCWSLQEIA